MFADEAIIEGREKTFKKWPFKTGTCTAKELAKAGFYMPNKKFQSSVQCYYCFKELEGWEPSDIPMAEHRKHASYCAYVKRYDKAPTSLLLKDVILLEKDRTIRKLEIEKNQMIETHNKQIDDVLALMTKKPKN